ncbi:MAG: ribosome-associated translation inhibitor RaiA [Armatimonadetes bacterium]|nr:ribosome-associated translation inhibitor RaiA [Armatimonadota bacterium]
MLINIKGKNVEVTDALRSYIEKKLPKLEKYFQDIREANVVLSVQRGMQMVEVLLEGDGILLRGEERRVNDMYASIDEVVEKLEGRVKKFKRKRDKSIEEGPKARQLVRDQARVEAYGAEDDIEEDMPSLVRTKRFALKPMTPEEAAQQMELLHHSFFVFRNAETEEVNVIYLREDGNYGLIEPA